jgi:hypothetical protein
MKMVRIEMPRKEWTPFDNRVFTHVLKKLQGKSSAALYFYLYDEAYHSGLGIVTKTASRLAHLTGMDARVTKTSLDELKDRGLIYNASEGIPRSRTQTDTWVVSHTGLDLKKGGWTPVPRIVIHKYIRRFPNAVLLPLLLFHQHKSWRNECWVGVAKLSELLNWSKTRVRGALRRMIQDDEWTSRRTGLPRPLTFTVKKKDGKRSRHYRVLAVSYSKEKKKSERTVGISPRFQEL